MKNNIQGIMMRPCSLTEGGNEEIMLSTKYSTKENFLAKYEDHMAAMQIVAECAKIYITNNWEKVTDWTNLDVVIEDNRNISTHYYNYVKDIRRSTVNNKSKVLDELFERIDKEDEKNHNPVKTITNVVLDTTDGDFSLTINEQPHLWISDESVIIIANYIEEVLKTNE